MKNTLIKLSIFGATACLATAAVASLLAWRAMRDISRELHRYDEAE